MKAAARARIDPYRYPEGPVSSMPSWPGYWESDPANNADLNLDPHAAGQRSGTNAEGGEELTRLRIEEARRLGFEQGRQAERQAMMATRANEQKAQAAQAASWIAAFTESRDKYLQVIEHEVVELALAIAARILRREAQMDPLLLTGAVRVALGQLANHTEVRIRVPESDLPLWTEAVAHLPKLAVKPVVIPDADLRLGDCVIETDLGSADLGVRAQLAEIERGFFDRPRQPNAERQKPEARATQQPGEQGR